MFGVSSDFCPPYLQAHRALLAISIFAISGCATTTIGENAEVYVEGDKGTVNFTWTPNHPWAAQLKAQGHFFRLYAQYKVGGKPVEQDLGSPKISAQDRWLFQLPLSLKAVPESQVCMFVAGSRTFSGIPVRAKAEGGGDTVRFRYPLWEAYVRTNTQYSIWGNEVRVAEQAVMNLEAEWAKVQGDPQRRASLSEADCRQLAVRPTPSGNMVPANIVPPAQRADTAQRVCVHRTRNQRETSNANYKADLPNLLGQFMKDSFGSTTDRTRHLAIEFQQHWSRWAGRVGPTYVPEVGNSRELLPTGSSLDNRIWAWNKSNGALSISERNAIVAGLLDGYSGCVEDVTKQLRIQYEAWQQASTNQPERDRQYAEWQRSICLKQVNNVATLRRDLDELREKLSLKRAEQQALPKNVLATQSQPLNLNTQHCSIDKPIQP